jgi:alkanesulfonate monooxygenase SsuD/methylene tetrahydromethanopterin reductase-like flavin-dependent oxidoreductase (luciferase family)
VWWSDYGNTADGFAQLVEKVEAAAVGAGRAPGDVAPTAAVLVQMEGGTGRLMGEVYNADVRPVRGTPDDVAEHLVAIASAGATHAQLVVDPITEDSIARLGAALTRLDRQAAQPAHPE